MNRLILAGAALALGAATASPMLAWSADQPQPAQTVPVPPANPDQGPMEGRPMMGMGRHGMMERPMMGGPGMMGQMGGREEMGGMHHGGWRRHLMNFGMWRMSPKQRCEERLARRAGVIAYTIAKLDLTAAQRPLWDKVQAPLQAAGNKMRELCGTLPSREARRDETVLDRINRRLQFTAARLQTLQQTQQPMEQFYASLTGEQKAIINHPFRSE